MDLDPTSSDLTTGAKSQIIDIFLDSTVPLHNKSQAPIYERTEEPLLALLLYFDILILGPKPTDNNGTLADLVCQRIALLLAGKVRHLYDEAYAIRSHPPRDQPRDTSNETHATCSAQKAVDQNNFSWCRDR